MRDAYRFDVRDPGLFDLPLRRPRRQSASDVTLANTVFDKKNNPTKTQIPITKTWTNKSIMA